MNTNVVVLVGRVVKDPEIKQIGEKGTSLCKLTLAINHKRGDNEEVAFVDCEAWGKSAEILGEYLRKGSLLSVSGRLRQDKWEKEGKNYSKLLVVVNDFSLGPRPSDSGGSEQGSDEGRSSRQSNRPARQSARREEAPAGKKPIF